MAAWQRAARAEDASVRADRGRDHCHHRSAPFRHCREIARLSQRDRRRAAHSLWRRLLLLHAARDGNGRHRDRDGTRALRRSGADPDRRIGGRPDDRLARRSSRRRRRCACLRRCGAARVSVGSNRGRVKLLVLGGTRFLGRHLVDAALARGHAVTIFTRGQNSSPWSSRVEALAGNRDPRIAPGLAALSHGAWDAVVDTSGYVPRIVDASASLLGDRAGRYLFVSSISVYVSSRVPGQDETAPVLPPVDRDNEDIPKNYGALKASCEAVVTQHFGAGATNVRPGLLVGPFDPTDRFAYWVARFIDPALLGSRPRRAVVPAPPNRPIQVID